MNYWKDRLKSFKDKQSVIIISRFGASFFSLIILIMATLSFAWLSQNRHTSTESMQIVLAKPDDIVLSATVHACIGEDDNGVLYFNQEAAATNNLKKYMMLYRNNRQLLLHIHFEDPVTVEDVSLRAITDTAYFMGDGQHPLLATADGKGTEYDNALSSIIAFYVVNLEDTTYESTAAYKVNSLGTPYTFINKNDYSINNVLSLVNKQTVSDINIVLDYDPDLVSKIFSVNLGNSSFEKVDGSLLDEVFYVWDIALELTRED